MNNCVLMAEIVKAPELRYMQDGQTAIAEMTVQFPALRSEDPMEMLKVVGWGNLAQQIQEQFHQGDQVILEGRLNMVLTDRPEGFKEKHAELTVARVHRVQVDLNAPRIASTPAAATQTSRPQPVAAATATPSPRSAAPSATPAVPPSPQPIPAAPSHDYEPNYDDIPF
ncbi:single-stranded DNA-binding protein [Altericista sp. CCNU0014]|uniref:single-stranded DNA-binding protein n=1 Tax=Altericista sp. CCNU0014 TaxID=3082949 RepID=UPI00384CDBCB